MERKKKIAATIAAIRYLEETETKPKPRGFWQKASIYRMMQAKNILFKRGKLVGTKNL